VPAADPIQIIVAVLNRYYNFNNPESLVSSGAPADDRGLGRC